jgi:hypothetical protein
LHVPSTVRSPNGRRGLPTWFGPGPRSGPHGFRGFRFAEWFSAILICWRMKRRSDALRLNPCPTGATGAWAVAVDFPLEHADATISTTPMLAPAREGVRRLGTAFMEWLLRRDHAA